MAEFIKWYKVSVVIWNKTELDRSMWVWKGLLGKSKDNSANDNDAGGTVAAGRQLSKLSFVQFSDAAAVHKGPVGIKNGMMLLDSHWLGLAFETIGLYQFWRKLFGIWNSRNYNTAHGHF